MKKLALLVGLGWAAPALALPVKSPVEMRYSKTYNDCMEASGGVTVSMHNCLGDEQVRQDMVLNEAYKLIMARLSPTQQVTLRDAERVWIKDRWNVCDDEVKGQDGTMVAIELADCGLEQIVKRTMFLENYNP